MERRLFRSILLLITYTVLLILFIVKFDAVVGGVGSLFTALRPLLIGFAIAFVLHKPCNFFTRHYAAWLGPRHEKLARPLAVLTSYVIFLGLFAALLSLVIPQLVSSMRTFASNLNSYGTNLQTLYDKVVSALDLNSLASVDLSGISSTLNNFLANALSTVTSALPQLLSVTGNLLSGAVTLVLAVVFSIYMLGGSKKLVDQCRRLVKTYLPRRAAGVVLDVGRVTADTFTNFVTGQLIEACILGCLCFVGMTLFRFDYAPLIAVIIGVSALIPVAGAYLGAITSALLLVMINPLEALWFLIFLVVLQQLEGNLIYPRVVGTSIGLPGLWVLAAVTVGGGLFGFIGMLIGVPVTAVLYTLLRRDFHARTAPPQPPEPPK